MLVRNHLSPCEEYNFKIPPHIGILCDELVDAFRKAGDPNTIHEDDTETPPVPPDTNADDEEEFLVIDEEGIDAEPAAPVRSAHGPTETRATPPYCPVIQPKLRNLLVALYTQVPGDSCFGSFFSVIMHYIMLSSLRANGQWISSGKITHSIAATTFTGRLTLYSRMFDALPPGEAHQYHQYVIIFSETCSKITQHKCREFEKIRCYFEEATEAIMPTLYILHRGLAALTSADDNMILFNAPDTSGTSAIIGSRIIHLQNVKDVALDAYDRSLQATRKLTFGNPIFDIADDEVIHDNPRNLEPNWSFLKHPMNSWNWKRHPTLLEYVISNPDIFSRYGYYNKKGEIVWKPGACYQYMQEFFDLSMDLFVSMLLTAGAPGRGSEFASNLLANVSGGSVRNALVLFNLFALRGTYNKTSFATSTDKAIVRMPLMAVGRLFIRVNAFIRPLFVEWQRVFRPHMAHNASHFLFPGLDRPIATRDLSVKLSVVFHKKTQFKMSLGVYRQFMSFISDCNAPIFDAASFANEETAEQFGHTPGTHLGHYGSDARLPHGISYPLYLRTARKSAAYQMLFDFGPELMEELSKNSERIQSLTSRVIAIRTRQAHSTVALPSESTVSLSSEAAIQSFVSAIQDRLLPLLFLHLTRALSQCFSAVVDLFAPYQVFPRAPGLPTASHSLTHPYLLESLRRFRKDRNANFFNATQADATQLMYDRKVHFAYISATGESVPPSFAVSFG